MENKPNIIFLNIGTDEHIKDFNELSEITWCGDKVNNSDLTYFSTDFFGLPIADFMRTHQECGLLASELLEMNNELLQALKAFTRTSPLHSIKLSELIDNAEQLIQKHTKNEKDTNG